jgi:hypothetical protein
VAGELGDPGAEAEPLAGRSDRDGAERLAQARQHALRGVRVGAHQRDRELVAAHPPRDVARAQLGLEVLRELHERLVADRVAPRVVDLLEAVEVEDDDRHRVVLARGAAQLGVEPIVERPLVGEAGERILVGELLELSALVGEAALHLLDRARGEPPDQQSGGERRGERDGDYEQCGLLTYNGGG